MALRDYIVLILVQQVYNKKLDGTQVLRTGFKLHKLLAMAIVQLLSWAASVVFISLGYMAKGELLSL
jgi:hypothetical protein